ncbi:T9SS type A sorting domain-containing protein [Lishizhenia sp.]|uniref:T9SS type A sorting domain-containing protein n=1 Tax=Lishizhenia sp. TaxID=2497594 RepID=UPI00299D0D3E|nr:T9SS type A sorting domain-containing protein [Lishizhenia sp.]MDX1446235.1 T9SS type A sorting domain-containing protein [Lishizhenia sp.]
MVKGYKLQIKGLSILIGIFIHVQFSFSQCSVRSNKGDYTVEISLSLIDVNVLSSAPCPNGYNYNVDIEYNVTYTGTNFPSNGLDNLNGNLTCGNTNLFFHVPSTGGVGTTTTAQNYINQNCQNASPQNLNCNTATLNISYYGGGDGDDIPYQTIDCPPIIPSALDVSFLYSDLSVDAGYATYSWTTASEKNASHFLIERMGENQNWVLVDTVKASGSSDQESHYFIDDKIYTEGVYYYKLREVDNNGDTTFLDLKHINYRPERNLTVVPNPATDKVKILGIEKGDKVVSITTANAQQIDINSLELKANDSTIQLELSEFQKGVYFILLSSGRSVKFVKI